MTEVTVHVRSSHTMPLMRGFEVALNSRGSRYERGKIVYEPNPELKGVVANVKTLLESSFGMKIHDIHTNGNKLTVTIKPGKIWLASVEKAVAQEIGFFVTKSNNYVVSRK